MQVEQHIALDVTDDTFCLQLRFPEMCLCGMERQNGHLVIAVSTLSRGIQHDIALQVIGFDRLHERFRHKRHDGLDIPGVGRQTKVHIDGVAKRYVTFHIQTEFIDLQLQVIQRKMHGVKVHGKRRK